MTGAEPPLGSAAWSAAVGSLILTSVTPHGAVNLVVAVVGVLGGIITRRTLASARALAMPRLSTESGLSIVQILISMLIMQQTGLSGLSAIWIGVGVASLGAPLIERVIRRFELWLNRLIPDDAAPTTTVFVSPNSTAVIPAKAPAVRIVDVVDGPETPSELLVTEFKARKPPTDPDARMALTLARLDRAERAAQARKDKP